MLIDNKTISQVLKVTTLHEFLKSNIEQGYFSLVTGYFSVTALAELYTNINNPLEFKMVLGNLMQGQDETNEYAMDLTDSDSLNTFEITKNAEKAIKFLQQVKVEVRNVQKIFCHAKMYLYKDAQYGKKYFYSVGSSNLTAWGLGMIKSGHVELNTVKKGYDDDYKEVSNWFNHLWNNTAQTHLAATKTKTKRLFKDVIIEQIQHLFRKYTPLEIYHRVLYELFKEDVALLDNADLAQKLEHLKNTVLYNSLYLFQQRGVLSLIKMLQRHKGAILADAVGLGKTWQALAVMKFFQTQGYEILVLCPKKLENNWRQYLSNEPSKFKSDKLRYYVRRHSDMQEGRMDKYSDHPLSYFQNNDQLLLVIDESHNLRNDKSGRYQFLVEHILEKNKDVRVLLLSATPINNNLLDIRNQFKLMVKGDDTGFKDSDLAVKSLEALFRTAEGEFNKWQKKENPSVNELVQHLDKLCQFTDGFIVARTRAMIQKLVIDSGDAPLHFPTKEAPSNERLSPQAIGELANFKAIVSLLEKINLTAYRAAHYTKPQTQKEKVSVVHDERLRQNFLVRMMFILLLKRLESSWDSFHKTVKNIYAHHKNALEKVNDFKSNIAQTTTIDIEFSEEMTNDMEESANEDNGENPLDATLGKKNPTRIADIERLDDFTNDLSKDCEQLKFLLEQLDQYAKQIESKKIVDEKLGQLIYRIHKKQKERVCPKVIIFTTYADTAEYLYQSLQKAGFDKLVCITGQETKDTYKNNYKGGFEDALHRFAPHTKLYKERDWADMQNKYNAGKPFATFEEWATALQMFDVVQYKKLSQPLDILIATDCLSEGQNLQDCDCVINYDIHWNPVRLIQRMGRIDRIGSTHKTIMCINFWPAENYEELLRLKNRVEKRMALMTLAGSEITITDERLNAEIANSPWLPKQTEKMLEQLQTTWDDIDAGEQSFGLDDLSMEEYRQELFELITAKSKEFEAMPNGIYSGFQLSQPKIGDALIQKGLAMLLGYPKKQDKADKTPYQEVFLTYISDDKKTIIAEQKHRTVLQLLRTHKNEVRYISPNGLDDGNDATIEHYKNLLNAWLESQKDDTSNALGDIDNPTFAFGDDTPQIDEKFTAKNFDLICWFAITD
jgi:superfamily II DNA/RNA helicase